MNRLKRIFRKKEMWTELDTVYSAERIESIVIGLADHGIPYRIRAALLPVPINAVMPIGTMTQSMWYLSVHPDDVGKVCQYLRRESWAERESKR